jgi:hypothetical protein
MASRIPADGARPQAPTTRRRLLGRAAAVGLATASGGYLLRAGGAGAASQADDARIFKLALEIEYTEEAFYREALRAGALTHELREYARAAHDQDAQHLAALKAALGASAPGRPQFAFGGATKSPAAFIMTASKLEDIAVGGYNGQATNLSKQALAIAATIVSVEARHAAWVRALAGQVAAPDAVDKPLTASQVLQGLRQIGLRR